MISYILGTFFITFYALKLLYYLPAYKNEWHFARHNQWEFPDFYAVDTWLGFLYKQENRLYEALGCWFDGIEKRPFDFRNLFNSAEISARLGYFETALEILEKVKLSALPDSCEDRMLKIVEERQAKIRQALEETKLKKNNLIIEEARKIKKSK